MGAQWPPAMPAGVCRAVRLDLIFTLVVCKLASAN